MDDVLAVLLAQIGGVVLEVRQHTRTLSCFVVVDATARP
jgi:hypothetical protein